jgi:hypothetical protein
MCSPLTEFHTKFCENLQPVSEFIEKRGLDAFRDET